jgi:hypothetical protein
MIKRFVAFGLLLGLVMISVAYGQKATEIYIPIGKSPGLSGKYSVIGEIASFNEDSKTLTIRHDGQAACVRSNTSTTAKLARARPSGSRSR